MAALNTTPLGPFNCAVVGGGGDLCNIQAKDSLHPFPLCYHSLMTCKVHEAGSLQTTT